jgi:hypothetical protein
MKAIKISMIIILSILTLLVFWRMASSSKVSSKSDLIKYIQNEKNGLEKKESLNKVDYQLFYWPHSLLHSNDIKNESNTLNFILKCSSQNQDITQPSNRWNYETVLNRVSFQLSEYIQIIYDKKDTLALSSAAYSRNYGLTGSTDILLSFDAPKSYEKCQIKIKDLVFENAEYLRFEFESKQISNCPTLKNKNL